MTNSQKKTIRRVQAILIRIQNGEKPFFNVTQFENLGLVVSKKVWGTDVWGNKFEVGHTFHLTNKAKQYIKISI